MGSIMHYSWDRTCPVIFTLVLFCLLLICKWTITNNGPLSTRAYGKVEGAHFGNLEVVISSHVTNHGEKTMDQFYKGNLDDEDLPMGLEFQCFFLLIWWLCVNIWQVVKPFIEPKTYKKVKFVYSDDLSTKKIMEEFLCMEKLESAFGGLNQTCFNINDYAERMREDDKRMPLVSIQIILSLVLMILIKSIQRSTLLL